MKLILWIVDAAMFVGASESRLSRPPPPSSAFASRCNRPDTFLQSADLPSFVRWAHKTWHKRRKDAAKKNDSEAATPAPDGPAEDKRPHSRGTHDGCAVRHTEGVVELSHLPSRDAAAPTCDGAMADIVGAARPRGDAAPVRDGPPPATQHETAQAGPAAPVAGLSALPAAPDAVVLAAPPANSHNSGGRRPATLDDVVAAIDRNSAAIDRNTLFLASMHRDLRRQSRDIRRLRVSANRMGRPVNRQAYVLPTAPAALPGPPADAPATDAPATDDAEADIDSGTAPAADAE